LGESKLSNKYVDAHALKNPFPMAHMISDVEHYLWEVLSRGDKERILYWATTMKDLMFTIIQQVREVQ